eukprot:2792866-Rhodomonas_salina.1
MPGDIRDAGHESNSAVQLAIEHGHANVLRLLAGADADLSSPRQSNVCLKEVTPVQLAVSLNQLSTVRVL